MKILENFRTQARACDELGSPLYGALLRKLVDDYELGGASTAVLAGHENDPGPSALALRLLGSVHRLVLAGEAPELAAFYPSVGGEWDPVLGWEAFEQVLSSRGSELRLLLNQPPQTNEVGRASALYGGLLQLAGDLPVRLFEIGSSAGLNLRADHYRYDLADGSSYGSLESPVRIADAWTGRTLPAVEVRIAERVGSDIAPVDALSEDGRLTLMSYVWPDMAVRLARLRGALDVARRVPADVRREDAVSFLRAIEPADGFLTVVWHSIVWQYLSVEDREAGVAAIERLGARASASAPVAHLSMEPARRAPSLPHEYLVTAQVWPTGERRVLGAAAPHGVPTSWE